VAAGTVGIATLSFAVGGSIGKLTLPLAALVTAAWIWIWARRAVPDRSVVVTAGVMTIAIAVVILGCAIGGAILDGTFDGRWFHREAIIQLSDGWNPLFGDLPPDRVADDGARTRINGYTKAPWILAASVLSLAGRMEWSTALSFALLVAAAATSFAAVLGLGAIGRSRAAAIAAVATCNPIALCQLANPLIDGQLGSLILIVVGSAVLIFRRASALPRAIMLMAVILAVNTKQSALPFLLLLVGGLVVSAVVIGRRFPGRRNLAVMAAAFVIGVVGVGFHPHITNLIRHQNWAYPYEQKNVTEAHPPLLVEIEIGRVPAFFKSAFTRSRHAKTIWSSGTVLATEARIKMPFEVSASELAEFRIQGVRIGGGGPLYGAMLLTAAITWVLLLWSSRDRALAAGLLVVVLGLSVLAFPYPWVFRLVPHAWLLPLIPAAAALTVARRPVAAGGWAVLAIAAVNLSAVCWVWTSAAIQHTDYLKCRMAALASVSPIDVDFGGFRAERLRLLEHGVRFTEVEDPQRSLGVFLGWSRPEVLVDDPQAPGATIAVRWAPVHGTLRYTVDVVEEAPAGPGGGALTVYSRSVQGTSTTVPRPTGRSFVSVAACNHLGCGLPVVAGPVEGSSAGRPSPLLGVPPPGGSVETPFLAAWFPASGAQSYRVVVEDAESGELVINATTVRTFLPVDLPPHRSWRIMITAVGADREVAGRVEEFRTASLPELTLIRPSADAALPKGPVTLEWTAVTGATAYEYLVMEPGGRQPAARGVTNGLAVEIELVAGDEPISYSAIVRACPAGAACRGGRDRGWGPWSTEAGTGAINFTVVPLDHGGEGEP
jgi:hypothetical protein